MVIAVGSTSRRLLIVGGANLNTLFLTGVNNLGVVQLASSTGIIANTVHTIAAPSGPGGIGSQGSGAWGVTITPGTTASRTYVIQAFHTNTSGGNSILNTFNYSALEFNI